MVDLSKDFDRDGYAVTWSLVGRKGVAGVDVLWAYDRRTGRLQFMPTYPSDMDRTIGNIKDNSIVTRIRKMIRYGKRIGATVPSDFALKLKLEVGDTVEIENGAKGWHYVNKVTV